MIELLGRPHEPDRPLLDQVEERQALVPVLRDRDDEAKIRLDHLPLRAVVTALDPLCQLDLLRCRQQLDLADVLEEELQRVGRDLALGRARGLILLLRVIAADDVDVRLLERAEDLVQLRRIQFELPRARATSSARIDPASCADAIKLFASSVSNTPVTAATATALSRPAIPTPSFSPLTVDPLNPIVNSSDAASFHAAPACRYRPKGPSLSP